MNNKILTKAVALIPLTALLINPVQTMAGSNHTYAPVNNVASAKKAKYEKEIKIFPDVKAVKSKGKWAIVKTSGKKITGFIYDDVKVEKLNDTYGTIVIAVKKNGKWGFVNELGKETVSPKFDEVKEIMFIGVKVKKDGKWGLVTTDGDIIIPVKYDDIEKFDGAVAKVVLDDKKGLVADGKEIVPPKYDEINDIAHAP